MSTIPAKETDCKHVPDGRTPVCVPPANRTCDGKETPPVHLGRRHMRVKLCTRCPYAPRDLADHYRSTKPHFTPCATGDGKQRTLDRQYPGETHRRRKCSTILSTSRTAQPNNAPFATESSASSVTIPGEPPFVQRGALNCSSSVGRATANGYCDFEPPDDSRSGRREAISCGSAFTTGA